MDYTKDALIALRVSRKTLDALKTNAERNERTLSGEVRLALKAHLRRIETKEQQRK